MMINIKTKTYLRVVCTFAFVLLANINAFACEACNQNQPKILRNITHGGGPQSNWDYFVVVIMIVVTIYTLYATIKCFVKPKEKRYNEIKRTILTQQ